MGRPADPWCGHDRVGRPARLKMLQIVSAFAVSGLLVGIVSVNIWYREFRKATPPMPALDDLNVW